MDRAQLDRAIKQAAIDRIQRWPHRIREDEYGQIIARMHRLTTRLFDGMTAQDAFCLAYGGSPAWMKPRRLERRYRGSGPMQWTPLAIEQLLAELEQGGLADLVETLCDQMRRRAWLLAAAAGRPSRQPSSRTSEPDQRPKTFHRLRGSPGG